MEKKEYPEYKDSQLEWIEELPEHWRINKLKHISITEVSNIDKKTNKNELPILLCNYTDVYYNDEITKNIKFMPATARIDQISKFSLKKNDVIITKDSESPIDIAVPTWIGEDLDGVVCGYHLAHVKPGNSVNGKYLFYCLKSEKLREQYYSLANGVTRYGLSKGAIINGVIPLPPVEEQVTISTYLNQKTYEIDSLITDKEKLIDLLEEKRQAIITESVTKGLNPDVKMKDSGMEWIGEIPEHWDIKKVKHISTLVGSGKTPRGGGEVYSKKGITFIRSMNVHFEGLKLDDVVYIDESIDQDMKTTRVFPKDVLLNITGASIGRTCMVPREFSKGNVNQHVCIIRPSINIVPFMLSKIMASQIIQNQIYMSQTGSSREGLNFNQIKNLLFPLPNTIEEQNSISNYIDRKSKQITQVIKDVNKQIGKLKEYRQSLIYEAVTGKIDVRAYEEISS